MPRGIASMKNKPPIRQAAARPVAKADANPDERMGSNKPRKKSKGDFANPERVQRDLNRYRDEMVEDAPASGTPEDNP
jgi:hypothetical protein